MPDPIAMRFGCLEMGNVVFPGTLLGDLWRLPNGEWVFATDKGRFPEIAVQLVKYIKGK